MNRDASPADTVVRTLRRREFEVRSTGWATVLAFGLLVHLSWWAEKELHVAVWGLLMLGLAAALLVLERRVYDG